jgi:hypothetical protein
LQWQNKTISSQNQPIDGSSCIIMLRAESSRRKTGHIHRALIIIAAMIMAIVGISVINSSEESAPKASGSQDSWPFSSIEDVPTGSDEGDSSSISSNEGESSSTSSSDNSDDSLPAANVESTSFDSWFRVASENLWFGSSVFGAKNVHRDKKSFLSKADCAAAEDAGLVNISKDCIYACETCDLPNYRYPYRMIHPRLA